MGEPEYISDKIGEEYRDWEPFQIILINAPTGSGKSHFIFNKLLPFSIENNKKILYMVNRKVLESQLEKEYIKGNTSYIYTNINDYIEIKTYQSLENELINPSNNYVHVWNKYSKYEYIIYDECHYFYSDSNFNTYTYVSYSFLREVACKKVQVFISATIKNMEKFISNYSPIQLTNDVGMQINPAFIVINDRLIKKNNKFKKYEFLPNYDYIEVFYFDDLDAFITTIGNKLLENKNEKWLIFTDSIKRGKAIQNQLDSIPNMDSNDIVFIDSKYKNDEDASSAMESIINRNSIEEKIAISTSVMDNGVSIKDAELRNIVILCDTEEEFIQMLGRKREDGKKLHLYLWKRNPRHFSNRLIHMEHIHEFYNENMDNICYFRFPVIREDGKIFGLFGDTMNLPKSQNILKTIFNTESQYAKRLFFPIYGIIYLNYFSIERVSYLLGFYKETLSLIEEDPDAFINIQLNWINKTKDDVTDIAKELTGNQNMKFINDIKNHFESELRDGNEKALSRDEYLQFKNKIKKELSYLYSQLDLDTEEKEKGMDTLKKNSHALKAEDFNKILENFSFPYRIEEKKGDRNSKIFIIKKL